MDESLSRADGHQADRLYNDSHTQLRLFLLTVHTLFMYLVRSMLTEQGKTLSFFFRVNTPTKCFLRFSLEVFLNSQICSSES